MALSLISLFSLLLSGLIAGSVYLYYKKKNKTPQVPTVVFVIGIIFVILFGMILTPTFYFQLETALEISSWPSVKGEILSSDVIGGRAFRPDIKYEYYVDSTRYEGSSYLNIPGFGGRMNRLDAAEKLVELYPPGMEITVYYNPQQPGESTLNPHPRYSHYMKLGTSIILFIAGMTILYLKGSRKIKPLYRERTIA